MTNIHSNGGSRQKLEKFLWIVFMILRIIEILSELFGGGAPFQMLLDN